MALKPWYMVIAPREDLRTGKPLDAAEFAVHLDKARNRSAAEAYTDPEQFFAGTYLTKTLLGFPSEVVRRLSGELRASPPAGATLLEAAQTLSALYPADSTEKRWVDGVLSRKKWLGL